MSKAIWIGAAVVAAAALGGIAYLQYGQQPKTEDESAHAAVDSSAALPATVQPGPAMQDAISSPASDAAASTLPPLSDSDKAVQAELESLFGKSTLSSWLLADRIIPRIVATVDSLDGDPVPLRLRPLRYVEGQLIVDTAADGSLTLSPDNAKRYLPYVEALNHVDARRVADFYLRYQSLFQKAHEDLGYSGQSFNDRLLKTIDHLLATPEVTPPIRLARPNVIYEFDDAKLERLSSGQKIMIRMGRDNAAAVKDKLREIRAALVAAH